MIIWDEEYCFDQQMEYISEGLGSGIFWYWEIEWCYNIFRIFMQHDNFEKKKTNFSRISSGNWEKERFFF